MAANPYTTEQIGALFRKHREASGLTRTQLGAKIGVTEATISFWERGKGGIRLERIVAACDVFDMTLAEFFERD